MEEEKLPIAASHGHMKRKRIRGKQRNVLQVFPDIVHLDGQCQGRPEGEKHRFDQDQRGDQKPRALRESCKSLIISTLMNERKEEVSVGPNYGLPARSLLFHPGYQRSQLAFRSVKQRVLFVHFSSTSTRQNRAFSVVYSSVWNGFILALAPCRVHPNTYSSLL